jgi:hypothetical protein
MPRIGHGLPRTNVARAPGNIDFRDGKVLLRGFHPNLAAAKPQTIVNTFLNTRGAFSAFAQNVQKHSNGVTSYDITGLGPKFAYKPVAVSHLTVNGQQLSIVEIKIGPDKQSGAKSAYDGRAYQIYGEGKKGAWAAELWDNVKADSNFTDAAANLHNGIVDGAVGQGGYRGLADQAKAWESKNPGKSLAARDSFPGVKTTDSLLAFVSDPKNIPQMSATDRATLVAQLK